jgi:hypothetical protein
MNKFIRLFAFVTAALCMSAVAMDDQQRDIFDRISNPFKRVNNNDPVHDDTPAAPRSNKIKPDSDEFAVPAQGILFEVEDDLPEYAGLVLEEEEPRAFEFDGAFNQEFDQAFEEA